MSRRIIIPFFILLVILAGLGYLVWSGSRQASILVEWSTATELDTAGFNLYRGENPEGPFVKVNTAIIPASSGPLTGSDYSYLDENVRPERTYYYELEEIAVGGRTSRFGPISVKAQVGLPTWVPILMGFGILALFVVWLLSRSRQPKNA